MFLWGLAFFVLFVMGFLDEDISTRTREWMVLASFFLLMVGTIWRGIRTKRNEREYLKLHPPVTERLKDHFRPEVH